MERGKNEKKNLGQLFTTICSLSFETTIEIPSGGNLTSVFQSFRQERTPIGRNRVRQTVQFHLFVEMDDDSPVFPSRNNILDYIDRCSIEKNKGKEKKKKIKRNEFSRDRSRFTGMRKLLLNSHVRCILSEPSLNFSSP